MQVQKGKSIYFSTNPSLNLNCFVILMSTYYNKSNLKVKESSEQYLIEVSILNGVSVQFCFFLWKYKNGSWPLKTKFWWILKNEEKIKDIL